MESDKKGFVSTVDYCADIEPSTYTEESFTNPAFDFQRSNALRCCYEALKSLPDGLSVLDYGTGPSLHETVLTARKASKMILSDYSEANRKALRCWLVGDASAFNWHPHFQRAIRAFEGGGEREVDERVERIRRVVKAVVHCDLSKDPPIEKGYDLQYDVINSCFCLCVAAKSHEEYHQGVAKLAKMIKPGGVLMVYESEHRECQMATYRIKNYTSSYVAVTSDFAVRAFRDAGFVEVTVRFMEMDPKHPFRIERPERIGYFHIVGVKG